MTLTSAFLESIYAQRTGEVYLILLKIDHEDLDAPILVVNNTENITSNGVEYVAFPFRLSIPDEVEDQLPGVALEIDNVSREIVGSVRTISSPASATISVVMASAPNSIQRGPYSLTLRSVEYNQVTVSGSLQPHDILTEPFPSGSFSPGYYPGLFQ